MGDSEVVAAIVGAVLGGFLAAGSSLAVNTWQVRRQQGEVRRLFALMLIEDLRVAVTLYEQIAEDWKRSQMVHFPTLNELADSRQIFERSRETAALLKDVDLRTDLFQYYRRSTQQQLKLRNMQQQRHDWQAVIRERRAELLRADPTLPDQELWNTLVRERPVEMEALQNAPKLLEVEVKELLAQIPSMKLLIDKLKAQ